MILSIPFESYAETRSWPEATVDNDGPGQATHTATSWLQTGVDQPMMRPR